MATVGNGLAVAAPAAEAKWDILSGPELKEPEFVALFGGPGGGKTRLAATVVRSDPERWGKKALYVATDPRATGLRSVLPVDKGNLSIVKFRDGVSRDPYNDTVQLLKHKWRDQDPDIGTLIVDTGSVLAQDILQGVANSGKFSTNHITLQASGPGKLVIPMQGDYGAAQSMMMNLLRFAEQCPFNQLWLFHEEWVEPKSGTPDIMYGGPATVGQAIVGDVAAKFANVFHIELRSKSEGAGPAKPTFTVYTQDHGIWRAKLRTGGSNPMPKVVLKDDPVHFWQEYNAATAA